jgi:hypothetical protein
MSAKDREEVFQSDRNGGAGQARCLTYEALTI